MNPTLISPSENQKPASLPRRLGAILYDTLLLVALLMLGSFLYVPVAGGVLPAPLARALYQIFLLAIGFLYFSWFWVHGGQTLGLRTWKLRLVTLDGASVTWTQAFKRFVGAIVSWLCLGLGFLWVLVDREKLAWHDRFSDTRLVRLPDVPRK
jgi:uncharacterized RDD family membrane protein YckC